MEGKNDKFNDFLRGDPNLSRLLGKMFHIWDGNHKLHMWLPYMNKMHPNHEEWHIKHFHLIWTLEWSNFWTPKI